MRPEKRVFSIVHLRPPQFRVQGLQIQALTASRICSLPFPPLPNLTSGPVQLSTK